MNGGPAAGTDAPQLPNPFTPLAWLPPAEVAQFENVRYLLLGILGVHMLSCAALYSQISNLGIAGVDLGRFDVLS